MTKEIDTDENNITKKDVLVYLAQNPDFLKTTPEAADLLVPSKDKKNGRKVADFQYYLVEKARADKANVEKQTQDIIETARSNMHNQTRMHSAVLKLLEAESFQDFIHIITMDLNAILNVDLTCLVIESDASHAAALNLNGIRIVPEGTISAWMGAKEHILESDIYGVEEIYGGGAGLVRSQALLRIDVSAMTPPAILAFGSRDPNTFQAGQGVELISFLTRVIERSMRAWLNVPG